MVDEQRVRIRGRKRSEYGVPRKAAYVGMIHCVNLPAKGEPKTAFVMRLLVAEVALSLPD